MHIARKRSGRTCAKLLLTSPTRLPRRYECKMRSNLKKYRAWWGCCKTVCFALTLQQEPAIVLFHGPCALQCLPFLLQWQTNWDFNSQLQEVRKSVYPSRSYALGRGCVRTRLIAGCICFTILCGWGTKTTKILRNLMKTHTFMHCPYPKLCESGLVRTPLIAGMHMFYNTFCTQARKTSAGPYPSPYPKIRRSI